MSTSQMIMFHQMFLTFCIIQAQLAPHVAVYVMKLQNYAAFIAYCQFVYPDILT